MSYTCCSTKFRSPVPPGSTGKAGEALWALRVAPAAAPQVTRRGGPEKWSEKWHDVQWCSMMYNGPPEIVPWCSMSFLFWSTNYPASPLQLPKHEMESYMKASWSQDVPSDELLKSTQVEWNFATWCNLQINELKKNDQNQLHMWQLMPPTLRCLMLQKSWRLWNPAAHQPSVEEWNQTWFSSWFSMPGDQFGGLQLVCTQLCQKYMYPKKTRKPRSCGRKTTQKAVIKRVSVRRWLKQTQTHPHTHTHGHFSNLTGIW